MIIGGGDTGADCYGTAHPAGRASGHPARPVPASRRRTRDESTSPWPTWPMVFRTPPAHEEGGERLFETAVQRFVGDERGHVRAVELATVEVRKGDDGSREVVPTTEQIHELPADLVLLSIGFTGPDDMPLIDRPGLERNERGTIGRARTGRPTRPACSCAATPTGAPRSSCGRSPRAGPPRPLSTPTCQPTAAPTCRRRCTRGRCR